MWLTTMNPATRRLIKVMPEDAEKTALYFDLLLGDNLAGPKRLYRRKRKPVSRPRRSFRERNGSRDLYAKKERRIWSRRRSTRANVEGLHAEVLEQPITDTLTVNYMPYAMRVIVSRAIPEIDGFKPSHRKLLYTMYKMGLLNGARRKSADIVGQTMGLNPHGDAAIYETMVRLPAAMSRCCALRRLQGQLRQGLFARHGLRRLALHRGKARAHLRRNFPRHRLGNGRFCGQLFQHHEGADAAAHGLPERAGFGQYGHCRRHGQQHLRLQPPRGLPRDRPRGSKIPTATFWS